MKVVSWNIENVLPRLAALPALVEELGVPDELCLQELRIRQHDPDAVGALEAALPGYRCHYALARDRRNVTFRGGRMYGVATFVRGRWRAEVPPWDLGGLSPCMPLHPLSTHQSMTPSLVNHSAPGTL